jgi:hypothetical protein
MRITAYITGVIPVVAVAMRFLSRWLGGNALWWDDWIHFVSAVSLQAVAALSITNNPFCKVLCIPLCIVFEFNINAGVGQHLWDLTYPRVFAIGRWSKPLPSHTGYVSF